MGRGGDRFGSKCSDGSVPVTLDGTFLIGLAVPIEETESMEKLAVAYLANIWVVEVLDLLYGVLGFDVLSNGLYTGYLCTVCWVLL